MGSLDEIWSYLRKDIIHVNSGNTTTMLLYSAFVLLMFTILCLWDSHKTILDPRYTQNPVIDFLSFKSDPQLALLKPK